MVLPVGAVAPSFSLRDQHGRTLSLSDFLGRRAVLLVFLPLAFTPTCSTELAELAELESLAAPPETTGNGATGSYAGVATIGVSVDSMAVLRAWAEREGATFPLLSDFWPHGAVARSFESFSESAGHSTRVSYLIDRAGVIRSSLLSEHGEPRSIADYRRAMAALT